MERQRFTAEFKREAVRLMERGDKPVAQLALELGVPRNRLYKCAKRYRLKVCMHSAVREGA